MINVSLDSSAIERAEALLRGVEDGALIAVKNSLPRAATQIKKEAANEVTKHYALKKATVEKYVKATPEYSYTDNKVLASLRFTGNEIPVLDYEGNTPQTDRRLPHLVPVMIRGEWRKAHPGVAARIRLVKGKRPQQFTDAFTVRFKNGHTAAVERTGGVTVDGSDSIRTIMGMSVPSMLNFEQAKTNLGEKANEVFQERMDHEVIRLLNGWRGKK